jgi:hypothetical protein
MEAIGRLLDILPVADDVYVSLRDAGAVTFVGVLTTGDTWTITSATDASAGGAAVLSTVDRYLVRTTVGSAWQVLTQAVGSAVTTTSAQDVVAIHISAAELPAGHDWVKCTSTSTGIVIAIIHDLKVQRSPQLLPAMI